MRLKRIKLAGFKSFVDPTSIPFPDDMTAVVGPNGCGKSNVIDAVRWVLGESSAKNLRGDAMTDVIFNGSSARKPVSQCSVELVFDNASGRIQGEYANYNELSVKRLVTREAQSTYFLNGSKCRRRDVTDLFLGTGLGPRSYAIIEQGMISRLIESKPQELRVFIEEAAGISKYKERRRETENRIRHTKENLERLEDVRGELGQQLEKLQRQAAAAKRYKELKARERTLKGELAAIRWLQHHQHIQQLEEQIAKQDTEIEAFVAQQRGDEKGITEYREQQQDLKHTLEGIQQRFFQLGNDITRIEQNQIHARQRTQQIDAELRQLQANEHQSLSQQQHEQQQLEDIKLQIEQALPEQEMLEEALFQAEEQLANSEQGLQSQQSQWAQQEQQYHQSKQQVQAAHSQLQAVLNMQMRTEQRIAEIQQELAELEHDLLAEQLDTLEQQLAESEQARESAKTQYDDHKQQREKLYVERREAEQAHLAAVAEWQQNQAQVKALQSINDVVNEDDQLQESLQSHQHQAIWQYLEAKNGWEKALDTALEHWQHARVIIDQGGPEVVSEALAEIPGARILFSDAMTTDKPAGSLAACIESGSAPRWMTQIRIAEDLESALLLQNQLADGESVICANGWWLGADWMINGQRDQQNGNLARANQLKQLQQQAVTLQQQSEQHQQQLEHAEAALTVQDAELEQATTELKQAEQAVTQQQNQRSLMQMQMQQSQARQQKLHTDLHHHQSQLQQEQEQLDELTGQIEELEMVLADQQDEQQQITASRERAVQLVQDSRVNLEQIKSRGHQMALTLQGLNNNLSSMQAAGERTQQQLQQLAQRREQLSEEQQTLALPLQEQSEKLEQKLAERLQVEQQQAEVSDKLAEVEQLLNDVEKGHQGVQQKIQQLRSALESTRLECEGFRVRANGVLEQLQELGQPLKQVLASLPEQYSESQWQQDLEKTIAAVGRLGAVNLAAVEEYEVQAERKQHLDEQNDDLMAALDTLESAIRKIDKETRSRFRDTFDKVNNDLKGLFPKVFGGGSAYLELTDDDLLETGVTIMARPPGKKNSTIHLLSGGEKALTALSLVFAIFRLNPAPFCLLDEVDAPLDDANVGRFCKLVSEMSKTVQFIYITHNKIAMEMASHLTGVTMAEPGVSRMVAVDVDEAVAFAQA